MKITYKVKEVKVKEKNHMLLNKESFVLTFLQFSIYTKAC